MTSDNSRKSRWEGIQRPMKVAPVTRARIDAVKETMENEKQRQVTYTEVLDDLARVWEIWRRTGQLVEDVKKS